MVSAAVYLQMFLCGVVYCILAVPLLSGCILFCGFRREKIASFTRLLILGFGKMMIFFAVRPYVRVTYEDASGEPPVSGSILIFNHRSASDPFLVASVPVSTVPVQAVNGWPMRLPFFGFFARLAEYLDITRNPYDATRKKAVALLKKGVSIAVFPEGTRSGGKVIGQFHGTFFRIAAEAGVPIVPVAIAGNERIPDRQFRMTTGHILVRRLPSLPAEEVKGTSLYVLKCRVRSVLLEATKQMDEVLNHGS